MRLAGATTTEVNVAKAAEYLVDTVERQLAGASLNLVLYFTSPHFENEFDSFRESLMSRLGRATYLGCTAEGVIGDDVELERIPSMSLWAASMPDATIRPFSMNQGELEVTTESDTWSRFLGVSAEEEPTFIVLADPFRFNVSGFLDTMNETYPERAVIGGVASGADRPGQNVLWVNDELHRDGAVGVAISGGVRITPVVSQGCRPIGRHLVITKAENNVIRQLSGRPAMETLQEIASELPEEDLKLARQGIFVGRVINEYQESFKRGDFLIRNLTGADAKSGAIAIGDWARTGTTVQFHVRDRESADEDLRTLLRQAAESDPDPVRAALLFTCNGLGTRLWDQPHHDVRLLRETFGGIPIGGFFCAGEFGPIGGRNFIHGHTASIALLRDATA